MRCSVAKKINIMKACGGFEFALGLLGDQESGPWLDSWHRLVTQTMIVLNQDLCIAAWFNDWWWWWFWFDDDDGDDSQSNIYHSFRCHFKSFQLSVVNGQWAPLPTECRSVVLEAGSPGLFSGSSLVILQAVVCHCRHSHHHKSAPLTCRPYIMEDAQIEPDSNSDDDDPLEARLARSL